MSEDIAPPTEDAPSGFLHAWFIPEQVQYGTSIYKRADGTEVEITDVRTPHVGPNFEEKKYLGLVVEYACRKGQPRAPRHSWVDSFLQRPHRE